MSSDTLAIQSQNKMEMWEIESKLHMYQLQTV